MSMRMKFATTLMLATGLLSASASQAATTIGERSGNVEWNGWVFDYDTFTYDDGLILKNLSYNDLDLIGRLSFPVMSVYYEGNACGPYADRLNGPQAEVTWVDNARIVAREFEQGGKMWFELGIREFIGSYDIYQTYYFSEDGELDAHIFSRGMQCNYFHEHYPMWLVDFDVDGPGNDVILREEITGELTPMLTEFEAPANTAFQHGWYVEDSVSGKRVNIQFDAGNWNLDNTVIPETEYVENEIGGMVARTSNYSWGTYSPPSQDFPYVNGESLENQDIMVWYKGYLPHWPEEGAELWHSTGVRILSNNAIDTDGDGIPDAIDDDDDNDGVPDALDDLPKDPTESVDTDADGIGNNADPDDDNDRVDDVNDQFPLDPNEWLDTDGDGTGDNADPDADNDGITDVAEAGSDSEVLIIEDFEGTSIFTINPNGTDTATSGQWESADPEPTTSGSTVTQVGLASSGDFALITGPLAGASAGTNDVDGGITTARSAPFLIPANARLLELDWYFAHLSNGSNADFLRITLEGTGGNTVILEQSGNGAERPAQWGTLSHDVIDLRGEQVSLLIEAADAGTASLIEAGVDLIQFQLQVGLDDDGDGIENALDLDSDNDGIPDIIEAGLDDLDRDFRIDAAGYEGAVGSPPDTDGDGIADFVDLESTNAANDGTAFDIAGSLVAAYDLNGDGRLDVNDGPDGVDANGNGMADLVETLEPPANCGDPLITPAQDDALYVWTDCEGRIQVVATSSATASAFYTGKIITDAAISSLQTRSVESSDTVQQDSDTAISFNLSVGGPYTDAFSFLVDNEEAACVGLLDNSGGSRLLGGPEGEPMSGPFNPATLESCALPGVGDCGSPNVDVANDAGLWVWKDCSGPWSVLLTGPVDAGSVKVSGELLGSDLLTTDESLEETDSLINDGAQTNFTMTTANPWSDRFTFTTSDEASLCLTLLDNSSNLGVYAGKDRIAMSGSFNPATLESCTPNGTSCSAPDFDAGNERGLFTWVDCDGILHLVGTGGSSSASYSGNIYSDIPVAAVSTSSFESSDVLFDTDLSAIYFEMTMGGQWVDEILLTPAPDANLCIATEAVSANTTIYAGSDRTVVSSPFNPVTLQPCEPPTDNTCGNASIDNGSDNGLFVWRSCDDNWNLKITGPGADNGSSAYTGTISVPGGILALTPLTVEASDTLTQLDANTISFTLSTSTPWEDAFAFSVADAEGMCVTVSDMPAGSGTYAGVQKVAVGSSFNPVTLEACD